ncbi:MAG: hypothetical protein PWQ09_977 [Candidatus Cloacimonadota bacterium]|jgi:hypothetical protein|nr:hypothetical protein [Candidatus Cloacimonadota bacterium]
MQLQNLRGRLTTKKSPTFKAGLFGEEGDIISLISSSLCGNNYRFAVDSNKYRC